MKVIVAGSRGIMDRALVWAAIADAQAQGLVISEVVSGGARGADVYGEQWAHKHGVPIKRFPVTDQEWRTYGRAAGPRRNETMAHYGDKLIAVWDGVSRGTRNMMDHMRAVHGSGTSHTYLYIWQGDHWRPGFAPAIRQEEVAL